MKRILTALLLLSLCTAPAFAAKYDVSLYQNMVNSTFNDVVKEAGTVIAYRGIAPAEPQGITGFDVGVEASVFNIDSDLWDQVVDSQDAPGYLPVPRVHVRKGLPFGIDLGASYAAVPSSDIKVIGGEIQYAILDGSVALPALALRGHYSTLLGVDELDLETYGADAVVSKGFLMFTPYAGVGVLRTNGKFTGDPAMKLFLTDPDQSVTTERVFGGVQIALALLRLTLDVEYSELPVYTAKVSLGW
jgi:opacity protein-like surface antigen